MRSVRLLFAKARLSTLIATLFAALVATLFAASFAALAYAQDQAPPPDAGAPTSSGPATGPDQPMHRAHMPPPGMQAMFALHAAGLNDTQKQQVHAILQKYMQGDLGAAVKAERQAHRALDQAIWSGAGDQQVTTAQQALSAGEAAVTAQQRRLAAEVLALLTPDQQKQFQTALAQGPPNRGADGENAPPPPPSDNNQ